MRAMILFSTRHTLTLLLMLIMASDAVTIRKQKPPQSVVLSNQYHNSSTMLKGRCTSVLND
jgi:hypothetical protein